MHSEIATQEELRLVIKALEQKLDESTQHLQTLSETSLDWFWKTDAELRFTEVGERYFEITGVPVKNVLGKTRVELVSPEEQVKHQALWLQHIQDLEQRRPFRNLEYAIQGTHGLTRYVRINGMPLFDSSGQFTGYLGTGTDESERMETQLALEQAKAKLMQSEKLASVGQLAKGIAHEVNTPLGAIEFNIDAFNDYVSALFTIIEKQSEMLLSDCPSRLEELEALKEDLDYDYLKEDLPDLISQSKEGIERVSSIIAGLKEFSSSGDQNWTSIDINRTIKNAIESIDKRHKDNISIRLNAGELPEFTGIQSQLDQVFLCLISNAIQAIEKSGYIHIDTYLNDTHGKIIIKIKDSGVGMEEQTMAKIFEPFFTTKEVGSGTGLGLSMAYGILKAHHGSIEVHSQLGAGSTFCVKLAIPDQQ